MLIINILVIVYLVMSEGRLLIKGFRERKRRLLINDPNVELATIRPLAFLFGTLSSFEPVILVLISNQMLAGSSYIRWDATTLMALPSMAFSLGAPIGTVIYTALSRRMKIKKLTLGSVIIMAVCYVLTIPVVMHNRFFIFCFLKLVTGTLNKVAYGMISQMPYRTEIESERYEATREKTMANVSSGIFGALIAGFVSEKLGNVALYIVISATFIPVIIIMLIVIPTNCIYVKSKQNVKRKTTIKNFLKFLFSAPMISYFVFLILPLMVIEGYKSYLFPLYSTAADMPTMYVTTYYVIARVIMLMTNKSITKKLQPIDYWKQAVLGLLVAGLAFMCFWIDSTIVWAVIMLLITAITGKIIGVARAMIWPRQAKEKGLEIMQTSNDMSICEMIFFSLKEMILSAFLLLGMSGACTAVGVFCVVCTGLFVITTRNSAMAKKNIDGIEE